MVGSCHVSAGNCDWVLCVGSKCSCPLRCFSSSERHCLTKCRDSRPKILMVIHKGNMRENFKSEKKRKKKKTTKSTLNKSYLSTHYVQSSMLCSDDDRQGCTIIKSLSTSNHSWRHSYIVSLSISNSLISIHLYWFGPFHIYLNKKLT